MEMCAIRENGTRRRRWLANARNNTAATIGWILMTLPALARDNRNGFIRFTYTPHDLSAPRASGRYPASKQHKTLIIIRYYYSYRPGKLSVSSHSPTKEVILVNYSAETPLLKLPHRLGLAVGVNRKRSTSIGDSPMYLVVSLRYLTDLVLKFSY